MLRHVFVSTVAASLLALAGNAWGDTDLVRDPVGEKADYVLDRASARTTSMVRGGSLHGEATRFLPDNDPPAYEVILDYKLDVQWSGERTGRIVLPVDAPFFTPEFLVQLRAEGHYESKMWKLRHMGFGDARNMDGNFYPNCDKVLIYDIDMSQSENMPILAFFRDVLAVQGRNADELEDMEILTHIKYGIPVLGAVKVDVTGKYSGLDVKAGFDYKP